MGRKKQNTEEIIQTLNTTEETNGDAQVLADSDDHEHRITEIGNTTIAPAYALVWDSKTPPTNVLEELIWSGGDQTKRWLYKTGWTGSVEINLTNTGAGNGHTYDIGEIQHTSLDYGYITGHFFTHDFTTNAPQTITIEGSNYDLYEKGVMYVGEPLICDNVGTFDSYVEVHPQEEHYGWVDLTDQAGGHDWLDTLEQFGDLYTIPSNLTMYIFPLYILSTTITQKIHLNHNTHNCINTIIHEIPDSSQSPNENYSNLASWLGSPTGSECDAQQAEIYIDGPGLDSQLILTTTGSLTFKYDNLETVDIYVYSDATVLPVPVTTDGYPIIFQGVALTNSDSDVNECFYLSRENMDNGEHFSLDYKEHSDFFEKGELLLNLVYTEMYPVYSAPPVIAGSVENGVISGASKGDFSWKLNYGVDYGDEQEDPGIHEITGEDILPIQTQKIEWDSKWNSEEPFAGVIGKFNVNSGCKVDITFVLDTLCNYTIYIKDCAVGSESTVYIYPYIIEYDENGNEITNYQYTHDHFLYINGEGDGDEHRYTKGSELGYTFTNTIEIEGYVVSELTTHIGIGYIVITDLRGEGSYFGVSYESGDNSADYDMNYTSYTTE